MQISAQTAERGWKEKNAGQNAEEIGNDDLPQSMDWSKYRPGKY